MSNKIVAHQDNVQDLVDIWMEQEHDGVELPVSFDDAWRLAGYSRKDSALRKLNKYLDADQFHKVVEVVKRPQGGGSKADKYYLSCDGFKHFCLLAATEQGRQIRQYFIEAEKKWRLVQEHHPQVADEVEVIKLQIELAQLQTQQQLSKERELELRNTIVQTCPEPVQQKILGYTEVKVIEYRDRIIKDDEMVRDGTTINKTALCRRYSILTRNGKPDYRKLKPLLAKLPSEAMQLSAIIRSNEELKREFLGLLDEIVDGNVRQLNLGE